MIPPPSSDFGQEACGRLTLTFPRPVMIDEERRLGDLALRLGRHLSQLLKEREEVSGHHRPAFQRLLCCALSPRLVSALTVFEMFLLLLPTMSTMQVMFENISQEVQASPATGAALVHAASCAPAQLPPAASLLAKAKSI
jgi:hypothetical protein